MKPTLRLVTNLCLLSLFGLDSPAFGQIAQFAKPEPIKRETMVYWTDTPPVMDGDLSDALWQRMPRATGMVDITFRHAYVLDQTIFSVAYDRENIYVAIDCRDRFPEKITAVVTERDGNFWVAGDETADVFFDPDGTGKKYIQTIFNPLGTRWDFRNDQRAPKYTGWDGEWSVAAKRTATGWTAEFAFPFTDLPMETPEPGFRLRANVTRFRSAELTNRYSSWSVVTHTLHNTQAFGEWIFAAPDVQPSRDEEMALNDHFVSAERGSLQVLALSQRAQREAALMNRLPESLRSVDLVKRIETAKVLSEELRDQATGATTLDAIIAARMTAQKLNEALGPVARESSLLGLSGPLDGLSVTEHGITRQGTYWILSGERGVHAIASESGALAGVWDRSVSRRVIAASYDLYSMETQKVERHADERSDVVNSSEQVGNALSFSCSNPDLPGLEISKRYELLADGKMLVKRVAVSSDVKELTLLGISSNTLFDPEFRQDSLYNRTMSAGIGGDADVRPTIPAREITGGIIQRGGNNKACGWAQFVLANTSTRSGVAQYLYKMNDRYVWAPYGMTSSYWNADGWEMSVLGTFLEKKPFSAETRIHLFDGDHVEFYHEYLELPAVKAARAVLPVHPDVAGLRSEGERGEVAHDRLRSDEMNLVWGIPRHNIFSHWPSTDDDEIVWIEPQTQEERRLKVGPIREAAEAERKRCPRHRLSYYWVHTDLHPNSETYREHPEFVIQTKNGGIAASTHPYSAHEADMSKEFTEYVVPRYEKMVQHLGLGFLYFDFYGGASRADWGQGKVIQTTDYMYFNRSIRQMLADNDGLVFYNGNPGQLYCDINFSESMASVDKMEVHGKDWWRWSRERLMYFKLLERDNMVTIPIMWQNYKAGPNKGQDNNRDYTNVILGLGMRPHTCYYEYNMELKREDGTVDMSRIYNYELPYKHAALEMHNARLANVGLQPRYWTDPASTVEAYVLRKGPAYFFTATNHKNAPADLKLTADISLLGLEVGKRLFRWDYTRRDDDKVPRLIGPETPRWDRLFTRITCTSEPLVDGPRLTVGFANAEVNYTRVATLTHVPGVFHSVEDQELQFRIPRALRCSLEGAVDEKGKRVTLRAKTSKSAVIAAWWPESWGLPEVEVDGEVRAAKEFVQHGGEQFVLVPVGKGNFTISVSSG